MELFSIRIQRTFQLVSTVITGGDKHEGGHDVAAHDDFIHYILHIHYHIRVIKIK